MVILIGAQIASADESSEDIGWSSPVYIQGIDDLNLRGWVCNPVQYGVRFCYGRTDNLYHLKGETTPQNNTVKAQPYFIVNGSEVGTGSCQGGQYIANSTEYDMAPGSSYSFRWRTCY